MTDVYFGREREGCWDEALPAVKKNPYMPEMLPPHAAWPCSFAAARMPTMR